MMACVLKIYFQVANPRSSFWLAIFSMEVRQGRVVVVEKVIFHSGLYTLTTHPFYALVHIILIC